MHNATHKISILIVEDEPITAISEQKIIESLGHRVTEVVYTGEEAVRSVADHQPDLALVDINLGNGIDGIETANAIRKSHDVPVIYVTAQGNHDTIERVKQSNPFGFVLKPFSAENIAVAIEMALHKYALEKSLARKIQELDFQKATLDKHAIVSITGVDGRITYANEKFCDISGYTQDELLGHTHRIVKSDHHPPEFFEDLWQTISSGKTWHGEIKNRKKDGSHYWVKATIVPTLNDKNKPFQYIAIRTDITAQKETETEIYRRSEIQMVQNKILRISLETLPIFEKFKKAIHAIQSLPWLSILPKAGVFLSKESGVLELAVHVGLDAEIVTKCTRIKFGQCLCGRAAQTAEIQYSGHVDERHDISFDGMADHGHYNIPIVLKGKVLGVIVIYLPPGHKRKKNEMVFFENVANIFAGMIEKDRIDKNLKISEERYRQVTDVSTDWVWEMDADLKFTYISQDASKHFGFDVRELIGKTRRQTLPESERNREKWKKHFRDLEKRREFRDFQYKFLNQGLDDLYVSISGSPIFDDDGTFLGYRGTGTNITKQVHAEFALRQARLLADRANQAKSDFLSSMSHELRTPLNAILGFGQMLEFNPDEPLSEAQQDCVDQIMKGGNHLLDLINDILDLAKIEAGKVDLSIESVSPKSVLNECLPLVTGMAEAREIIIDVSESFDELLTVRADHTRFKQVFLNLISNAIKYNCDKGKVFIDMAQTGNGMVRISVSDTGHGIEKREQKHLFKPFSRLNAQRSDIEGTGIGLVVCKDLIEIMSGHIGFDSEVGKGSTFWFELPLSDRSQKDIIIRANDDITRMEKEFPAVKGTLLYVEDNPSNLKLMELIVSRINGLSLIVAQTGEEGIRLAVSQKPDMIILDVNLPQMDGFAVLRALRKEKTTQHVPVLALSAAATKKDIKKAKKAGFLQYLTKPIQVPELVDAIAVTLDGKHRKQ